jgi:hypothetical protein
MLISALQYWNYLNPFSMGKVYIKGYAYLMLMCLNCHSLAIPYVSPLKLNNYTTGRLIFVCVTNVTVDGVTPLLPIPHILGS